MASYANSSRIDLAVAVIERGEYSNYTSVALAFNCDRTSISKRIRLLIRNRREADSLFKQCLTNDQEQALIDRINYLSQKQIPPISRIVKNLAKEIRGASISKN